jgi:hypothetical protein
MVLRVTTLLAIVDAHFFAVKATSCHSSLLLHGPGETSAMKRAQSKTHKDTDNFLVTVGAT